MIAIKFGGTSLADVERIRAAADIVSSRMARGPLVIVSALAGVTDLLEQAIVAARVGDRDRLEPLVAELERRHRWVVAGAVDDPGRRHHLSLDIDRLLDELRQRLRSIRILGESTPRAADAVLAFGERLSGRLVGEVFRDRGLPAESFDPRQVLVTDASFGNAEPDTNRSAVACRDRIAPALAQGRVPVVGGFVGATTDGETTTLGRGGSDTTAAVLAMVLDAEAIEIWTDVDGMMSADPRLVANARTLPRVTFAEAAELAFYGARVLHPASIEPAVRRQIPVWVLNSMRPDAPGTRIVAEAEQGAARRPVAVASRGGIRALSARRDGMRTDSTLFAEMLVAFSQTRTTPLLSIASGIGVDLAVGPETDVRRLAEHLARAASVRVVDERAIVSIVGSALPNDGEVLASVLGELARFKPDFVAAGVHRASVTAVVEQRLLEPVVRRLHERFFECGAV